MLGYTARQKVLDDAQPRDSALLDAPGPEYEACPVQVEKVGIRNFAD